MNQNRKYRSTNYSQHTEVVCIYHNSCVILWCLDQRFAIYNSQKIEVRPLWKNRGRLNKCEDVGAVSCHFARASLTIEELPAEVSEIRNYFR